MDPTILAAAAGIAGGDIGAIIGGVFALKATKRQVEVMLLQSRGDVNERLYSQSLMIVKFFAENPELRPYFYDNKDLSRAESDLQRLRVLNAAEMVGGFMELVALQIGEQPAEIQLGGRIISSTRTAPVPWCVNIWQPARPGTQMICLVYFQLNQCFQQIEPSTNGMHKITPTGN